jgi:hypothetical protein
MSSGIEAPVDFSLYLDLFANRHGFGPRIRTRLHRRLDQRLGMPLFDTDISRVVARIPNPAPLLLVHDPDDPDSPYATSVSIVGVWPEARLVTTRGLGRLAHYRALRHRPAINAAVAFIGCAPDHGGCAGPEGQPVEESGGAATSCGPRHPELS